MEPKKITKTISRSFAWLALLFCSLIVRILPLSLLYGFAKVMAKIVFLVAVRQRKIALESLSIAFGKTKSRQELNKIARNCFSSVARSGVEMIFFMKRPHLLREGIILQNKHILDEALLRKKGAILVSGHFGNFPLAMLSLVQAGYQVGGIMRPMRDQRVERMFSQLRNKLGIKTIYSYPRKACVEQTIRALKSNEVVCIQLDQNFGTGGIFVDFFGQQAATATGPVVFALRTKAAVIPSFIVREKDGTNRIIFEPEFNLKQEDSFNKTVLLNIQGLTDIIESYVRRYPEQWGWMHRRWKTRPKGNP
jgi:KDO2-lipid IV(A) lauroyltransferase